MLVYKSIRVDAGAGIITLYTYSNKLLFKQDAQLSQRDRTAGCATVFARSRRLELGDNILRTLKVYLQPL